MPFKFCSAVSNLTGSSKQSLFKFEASLTTIVVTNTHHVNKAIRPHLHNDVTCVTICTNVGGNKGWSTTPHCGYLYSPCLLSRSLFFEMVPWIQDRNTCHGARWP